MHVDTCNSKDIVMKNHIIARFNFFFFLSLLFKQIPMLTEALTSSVLLLKLGLADVTLEDKVAPIWNTALDLQKGHFTGEKFFTQSSEEGEES